MKAYLKREQRLRNSQRFESWQIQTSKKVGGAREVGMPSAPQMPTTLEAASLTGEGPTVKSEALFRVVSKIFYQWVTADTRRHTWKIHTSSTLQWSVNWIKEPLQVFLQQEPECSELTLIMCRKSQTCTNCDRNKHTERHMQWGRRADRIQPTPMRCTAIPAVHFLHIANVWKPLTKLQLAKQRQKWTGTRTKITRARFQDFSSDQAKNLKNTRL